MVRLLEPGADFPSADAADDSGLVAAGNDLEPETLLAAYRSGIFPWPLLGERLPVLWFSPDPRFVLFPAELHVSRSLAKTLRRAHFRVRYDFRFRDVVEACRTRARPGQDGTWITNELVEAYVALHELGVAHSVAVFEVSERNDDWASPERDTAEGEQNLMVGGLYGVGLGQVFFGESMFSLRADASKVGFVTLARRLRQAGCGLIDCQQGTSHLASFGARPIGRRQFLDLLPDLVDEHLTDPPW